MFESLFDHLEAKIQSRNGTTIELSNELSEYHAENSKYIIKNSLYQLPNLRKWRITRLDGGDRLQVFNSVAYPIFKSEIPIFGVDILWFGTTQKLLAVLDYQPLIQNNNYLDKYCSRLKKIKKKFSGFDNNKMKNIYDQNQYFSPWVILCRGNITNLDTDLDNIFKSFLEDYLNMIDLNNENEFLNVDQIKKMQIEYDKYSSEKDPAGKLFKSFFGESWTENFIKNYLFTLSKN